MRAEIKKINKTMISEKANRKLFSLLTKTNKIEELAVIIAAKNVLIEDITKKGELIIKEIEDRTPIADLDYKSE